MEAKILGGLLKNIYPSFDMASFSNRLRLQKAVYLMKVFGIDLGYFFNFYVYGPYSTDLARSGFFIENYQSLPRLNFKNERFKKRFSVFISEINKHSPSGSVRKDDTQWLECASSMTFLKIHGLNKTDTFERMKKKNTHFEESYLESVWKEINEWSI